MGAKKSMMKSAAAVACVVVPALLVQRAGAQVLVMPEGVSRPVVQGGVDAVSPEKLDQLVAPIALYPDALIAQVLSAATYPLEVVQAARWVRNHADLQGVDDQAWDPSVGAVAHYPTVLQRLDDDLDWTIRLGQAFLDQPNDVMDAIQRQRARAQATGALVDTAQQVVLCDADVIRIVPAQPEVIYVPVYDPQVVYVQTSYFRSSCVSFGIGFRLGWWLDLDCDWRSRRVCHREWQPCDVVYGPRWHGQVHDNDGWHDRDGRRDHDGGDWRGRDGGWDRRGGRDGDEWKHNFDRRHASVLEPTRGDAAFDITRRSVNVDRKGDGERSRVDGVVDGVPGGAQKDTWRRPMPPMKTTNGDGRRTAQDIKGGDTTKNNWSGDGRTSGWTTKGSNGSWVPQGKNGDGRPSVPQDVKSGDGRGAPRIFKDDETRGTPRIVKADGQQQTPRETKGDQPRVAPPATPMPQPKVEKPQEQPRVTRPSPAPQAPAPQAPPARAPQADKPSGDGQSNLGRGSKMQLNTQRQAIERAGPPMKTQVNRPQQAQQSAKPAGSSVAPDKQKDSKPSGGRSGGGRGRGK